MLPFYPRPCPLETESQIRMEAMILLRLTSRSSRLQSNKIASLVYKYPQAHDSQRTFNTVQSLIPHAGIDHMWSSSVQKHVLAFAAV
jgi:hypothetical protein